MAVRWPVLSYAAGQETWRTLHLWLQVVGKVRLARTPWLNHSWQAPLYLSPRGLTTGLIAALEPGERPLEIELDMVSQTLKIVTDGPTAGFALAPMPVAHFYNGVMAALDGVGMATVIHGAPNELPTAVPFARDSAARVYDPAQAALLWRALAEADRMFKLFRTGFLGKATPSHLFWGSFDLAVTRFSGRPAPRHPGGVPNLPDAVTREAYSHEVSSAGFWPGGEGLEEPAFYAYAYPTPEGFSAAEVRPSNACFDEGLGEFVLPYAAIQSAADPDAALLDFLQSTYDAAADLGRWDRSALECGLGAPRRPRPVD